MGRPVAEDTSELTTVFTAIGPQLRRFLVGVTKDVHAAEDVMQAAFAKALERRPTGPAEAVKAWFFKVALNEALAKRRSEERFKAAAQNIAWMRRTVLQGDVDDRETVERVKREIDRLPNEQLLVVRKRLVEGKTFAEIAREESLPLGTVLTRMRLALERLRRRMGE
jgi:RNA polymerase sigma factor (sigma-70 family)